ncbi:hypothetical protein IWQ61_004905 [Dispira simplex]|nr:hypothetical protein IWQ61_004905 [Dispira simplex]
MGPYEQFRDMRDFFIQHPTFVMWNGGRWKLMTTDVDYCKDIFMRTNQTIEKAMPNPEYPESLFRKFIGTSLAFSNSEVWRRIRRIVGPAFNYIWPTRVIGDTVIRMFRAIEQDQAANKMLTMDIYLGRLTMDVLGRTAYGFDFNSLTNPESKYAVLLSTVVKKLTNPFYILFPFLDGIPGFRRPKLNEQIEELDQMLFGVIDMKRKELAEKPIDDRANTDMLSLMLEACQDPSAPRITNKELRDNVVVFYLAGQETTAGALGFWMYEMSKNTECQEKARQEVLQIMGDAPEDIIPTDEQLKEFKYLKASIDEAMRFHPPLPAIVARETVVEQKICGVTIPAGERVGTNVVAMHHHPKHFKDPDTFRPERFVDLQDPKDGRMSPYLPFGSGPRQCIGKNFAMLEARVVTSMMLRKYKWTLKLRPNGKEPVRSPPFDLYRFENLDLNLEARY